MSTQRPSASNFQPWYTQRRPHSSLRPKNRSAPRCGAARVDQADAAATCRGTRRGPRPAPARAPAGRPARAARATAAPASRSGGTARPSACPAPVRVSSSLSSALSIAATSSRPDHRPSCSAARRAQTSKEIERGSAGHANGYPPVRCPKIAPAPASTRRTSSPPSTRRATHSRAPACRTCSWAASPRSSTAARRGRTISTCSSVAATSRPRSRPRSTPATASIRRRRRGCPSCGWATCSSM